MANIPTDKPIKQFTLDGTEIPLAGGGGGDETCTIYFSGNDQLNISYLDVHDIVHNEIFTPPKTLTIKKTMFGLHKTTLTTTSLTFTGVNSIVIPNSLTGDYSYTVNSGYISPVYRVFYPLNNTLSINTSCFLPDTLITLADGSTKQAKDITYSDKLKVWDFDKGNFGEAFICWLTRAGQKNGHYYKLTFSDGSVCKFTGDKSNHKIYDIDKREFVGVAYMEIGDKTFSENGIVTITNKEYIEEECEYYNLITTGNINCFCNGILASDRYGNMYPIDENMKYIKGDRPIRPYSEFEPHHIKKYWYDTLRLGELTDDMNDIINYIGKLECQMLPLPEDKEGKLNA